MPSPLYDNPRSKMAAGNYPSPDRDKKEAMRQLRVKAYMASKPSYREDENQPNRDLKTGTREEKEADDRDEAAANKSLGSPGVIWKKGKNPPLRGYEGPA